MRFDDILILVCVIAAIGLLGFIVEGSIQGDKLKQECRLAAITAHYTTTEIQTICH